ncbi:VCBS repeat-containing protein [bacterium]|nr:VCBS repeat-containing protein [bacterium]
MLAFQTGLLYAAVPADSSQPFLFTNSSLQCIPDIQDVYGVSFRDIDLDGRPDLYLVCFRALNRLLLNQGPDKPFLDATIASGLGGNLMPMGTKNLELGTGIPDLDNDGDGDVVLAGWGESSSLFRNALHLQFIECRDCLEFDGPADANACVSADVNGDGLPDLFFTDEHDSNHLLIQDKRGRFRESTRQWGLVDHGVSQGAQFSDVDLDGDPDLYVANWFGPDRFYMNIGSNRYEAMVLDLPSLTCSVSSNAPCFGDIDNDGDFDLIVTNREGPNFIYLNETMPGDSDWIFQDISRVSGLDDPGVSYGCVLGDFDCDGWQDAFVTNIGANRLYRNLKNGSFEVVQDDEGRLFQSDAYSTGASLCDIDGDGDLDLFTANKDTFSQLFINNAETASFVKFHVRGVVSNRDGLGSRLLVYTGGHLDDPDHLLGIREVTGGSGYLSMNDPCVHFGIGSAGFVDVRVVFPSGTETVRRHIRAGSASVMYERPLISRWLLQARRTAWRQMRRSQFWIQTVFIALFAVMVFVLMRLGRRRYRWHRATAGLAGMGFLGLSVIVLSILESYSLVFTWIVVDGLVFMFCLILFLYSEHILRLNRGRDRFRSVLVELGNQVTTIHDDEQLFTLVVRHLTRSTEFDRCCFLTFHPETEWFDRAFCHGCSFDLNQPRPESWMKTLQILKHEKIIIGKNTADASLFQRCEAQILIPVAKERLFGLLTLGSKKAGPVMDGEDMALFQTFAAQLGTAIENNAYVRQSNEMVKKLTEARVREAYMQELEKANAQLDQKNRDLEHLYNELKQTETQLIQSEKMASLGQLVAGISHELNNPVGFIYANLKQIRASFNRINQRSAERPDAPERLSDMQTLIEDALRGSQMVKTLVEHLRRFSHVDQAERKPVNIHEGLETCLMILRPQLGDRIQIERRFEASGIVEGNIGQLNQVFLNVLSNAIQAIRESGRIFVSTRDEADDLLITIEDNGCGIAPELLPKIYDPFFTTKEVGEGTGLGLSISYAIIQQHQGSIHIESLESKGSTVKIRLPRQNA